MCGIGGGSVRRRKMSESYPLIYLFCLHGLPRHCSDFLLRHHRSRWLPRLDIRHHSPPLLVSLHMCSYLHGCCLCTTTLSDFSIRFRRSDFSSALVNLYSTPREQWRPPTHVYISTHIEDEDSDPKKQPQFHSPYKTCQCTPQIHDINA